MKQKITYVEDLKLYLQTVIKPILTTPNILPKSKKWKVIQLSSREILGIFLVCIIGKFIFGEDWTIATDPDNGDGIIFCKSGKREGEGYATEQVYIPSFEKGNLTELVLDRIKAKSAKGEEYGKNRHLIVFSDKHGAFDHKVVKEAISSNNIFLSIWFISKFSPDRYKYLVIALKTTTDPIIAYELTIEEDFSNWSVKVLGKI